MIISPKHAQRLINAGKAKPTTRVNHETGRTLQAIDHYDVQRVDHYFLPIQHDPQRFQ